MAKSRTAFGVLFMTLMATNAYWWWSTSRPELGRTPKSRGSQESESPHLVENTKLRQQLSTARSEIAKLKSELVSARSEPRGSQNEADISERIQQSKRTNLANTLSYSWTEKIRQIRDEPARLAALLEIDAALRDVDSMECLAAVLALYRLPHVLDDEERFRRPLLGVLQSSDRMVQTTAATLLARYVSNQKVAEALVSMTQSKDPVLARAGVHALIRGARGELGPRLEQVVEAHFDRADASGKIGIIRSFRELPIPGRLEASILELVAQDGIRVRAVGALARIENKSASLARVLVEALDDVRSREQATWGLMRGLSADGKIVAADGFAERLALYSDARFQRDALSAIGTFGVHRHEQVLSEYIANPLVSERLQGLARKARELLRKRLRE